MTRKFLQLQKQYLAGAGSSIGDTTLILKSFNQIDGTGITDMTTTFGDKAFGTLEPGKGTREEQISFTGITVNGDGTVTLTGVSSVTMDSPYTETPGVNKQHAGNVEFVITNTSGFYADFITPQGDYTISGTYSFEVLPVFTTDTDLDGTLDIPTLAGQFIHLEYLNTRLTAIQANIDGKVGLTGDETVAGVKTFSDNVKVPNAVDPEDAVNKEDLEAVTLAGAGHASETQSGLVSIATEAESEAGTDVDVDGRTLVVKPSQVLKSGINFNANKSYNLDDIANENGKIYRSLITGNLGNNPEDYTIDAYMDGYSVNQTMLGLGGTKSSVFSNDGMYMYTLTSSEVVNRYPLTEAFVIPDGGLVLDQTVTLTDETTMNGIEISSDGTRLYVIGSQNDRIYQYDLGTAYDISGVTTADEIYTLPYYSPGPHSFYLTPDDTKFFLCDSNTDEINILTFGTIGDVTTLSSAGKRLSTVNQDSSDTGIAMSADGTKMYMIGTTGDNVYQYTLSTAFDLSTASYDSVAFDISSQELNPYGITFSTAGTKMYIVGNNDRVFQYTLSTAWDVSTASYDSVEFLVSGQDTSPQAIAFSDDGMEMFMLGTSTDIIWQYDLSTAWDMTTASYSGNSFSYTAQETTAYGLDVAKDGLSIFIVGNNEEIYKYTMSTANDISTASYDSTYALQHGGTNVTSLIIEDDGSAGYFLDSGKNYVYQLDLATDYDLSTITYDWQIRTISVNNPDAITFSEDGLNFYQSDTSGNRRYQLKTAWDLDSIYEDYFIRPTTGDAWGTTTTEPTLTFAGASLKQEIGYIMNSKHEEMTITGFKFRANRTSGSSGGTNFGELTGRIYTVDGDSEPVASATEEKAQEFSTWGIGPAGQEFEVVFDTPVSLATAQDFVFSIQYNSTDSDTVAISNITATIETEGGHEYDFPRDGIIDTYAISSHRIAGVSPDLEKLYIIASGDSTHYEYKTSRVASIYWTPQASFGDVETVINRPSNVTTEDTYIVENAGFVFGNFSATGSGDSCLIYLNGVLVAHTNNTHGNAFTIPVVDGDVMLFDFNDTGGIAYFRPLS